MHGDIRDGPRSPVAYRGHNSTFLPRSEICLRGLLLMRLATGRLDRRTGRSDINEFAGCRTYAATEIAYT